MKLYYTTSDISRIIGIHSNTVRLYEKLGLISKPCRQKNGYRIFTDLHVAQFQVARLAFQVEVLQNGLRRRAASIVKACAKCDFDEAVALTDAYLEQIKKERDNAERAIGIVEQIVSGKARLSEDLRLTRRQAADYLGVTIDTLRNWELNGLAAIRRKQNGYRIYTGPDMERLTVIKSLRCANYSLSAILRMLSALSEDPAADIRQAIETSPQDGDILTACDQLITSLNHAGQNACQIRLILIRLRDEQPLNPPL